MEIKEKIIEILAENSDIENIDKYLNENNNLFELEMDSISFIKTVIDLEREFNIEFEDIMLDYRKLPSLDSICEYVEGKIKNAN